MPKAAKASHEKPSITIGPEDAEVFLLNLPLVRGGGKENFPLMPQGRLAGGGRFWPRFAAGEKISSEKMADVPTHVEFSYSEASNLGDFLHNSGALILSAKAAGILEQLEPGRHQIFPLKVQSSKRYREQLEAMGHVLVHVYQQTQAIIIEKSRLKADVMVAPPPFPEVTFYNLDMEAEDHLPHLCADASKARGMHLWRGSEKVLTQQFFASRQLKEAWSAAGCGPMIYFACPAEEVSACNPDQRRGT